MQSFLREQLQSTMRYFPFFNRIVLRSITLSFERNDDLNMTLWTKGSRLEQSNLILNASLIDIPPSCNIIKGIGNCSQTSEETITENLSS